jgi:nitroreductase
MAALDSPGEAPARAGVAASLATPYPSDPWSIREDEYPDRAPLRQKLLFFLRYAILAPSTYNSQPWLFRVGDEAVDVIADAARELRCIDPQRRELIMSCGAVVCNLRTAAANFGYATALAMFPDASRKDLVARVSVTGTVAPTAEQRARFRAIPTRRRNVVCFDGSPPSSPLLAALAERAKRFGAWLVYVEEPELKQAVVRLIAEADRLQMDDPLFRAELARWSREAWDLRGDGIPCDWHQGASSLPDFGAPEWSQAIGSIGTGEYHAAHVKQRVGTPPLLAVLGTTTDTPQAWLAAGQALLEAELQARAAGVWFTDFNQPIQHPGIRAQLRQLVRIGHPQALVRIGYGAEVAPTPRRSLEGMLLEA